MAPPTATESEKNNVQGENQPKKRLKTITWCAMNPRLETTMARCQCDSLFEPTKDEPPPIVFFEARVDWNRRGPAQRIPERFGSPFRATSRWLLVEATP